MTGASRKGVISLAGVLALTLPVTAVADEGPLVLEASTGWQLDYGRGNCTLARNFGTENRQVTLQMARSVPSDTFRFTVSSRGLRLGEDALEFTVLPDVTRSSVALQHRAETGNAAAIRFEANLHPSSESSATPSAASEDRLAAVEGITIDHAFEHAVILRTGPLSAADQAINTCVADLWSEKGIDLSGFNQPFEPATRLRFASWAPKVIGAYPREYLRRQMPPAQVWTALFVDQNGKPSACVGQGPEAYPKFEEAACEAMLKFARYEPARDNDGQHVPSFDTLLVTYTAH